MRGGCLCGAVRFEGRLPTKFVAHCHCLNCTRAHGAGCVTWAGFSADRFEVVTGVERVSRYRAETGATRSFCSSCGTTMLYESERWAGQVHVAVACMDDELDRLPTGHVYADRARPWCPITDDLPRYGGPTGMEPLP